MSDETKDPLAPADPPETQPPQTRSITSTDTGDSTDTSRTADPPETQPPGS